MVDGKRFKWWKLPHHHPVRIQRQFVQARAKLRDMKREIASANDEPSQWEYDVEAMFPGVAARLMPSDRDMAKAQADYDRKRALWEAAGCPTADGTRTKPRNRKLFAELLPGTTKKHAFATAVAEELKASGGWSVLDAKVTREGEDITHTLSETTQRRIAKGIARYLQRNDDEKKHALSPTLNAKGTNDDEK